MFDDMIADMEANTKLSPIVTELFLRDKKLIISLVFITQSYLKVSKTIRPILSWKYITKENNT